MADVVKTTVFLRHMNDYRHMNELYGDGVPRAPAGPLRVRRGRAAVRRAGRDRGLGLHRGTLTAR